MLHLPELGDGQLVPEDLLAQAPGVGVGVVPGRRHEQLGAGDRGQQRPLLLPHQAGDGGVAGVPRDTDLELRRLVLYMRMVTIAVQRALNFILLYTKSH